jgi:inhibitor of KinA sporulation pathway (predicted exonuclease)
MNKAPITKFLSLDLEMNQPSGSIIQIGAVVGDIETKKILEKLSVVVNPKEQISNYIINLTGITQEQVDNGVDLYTAYLRLIDLIARHRTFVNPITWGGGDSEELKKQVYSYCIENNITQPESWCFGRRWIDVKTIFVSLRFANRQQIQGGLARSMIKLGLKFNGRKHNAADDAENTFHMYCAILEKLKHVS